MEFPKGERPEGGKFGGGQRPMEETGEASDSFTIASGENYFTVTS